MQNNIEENVIALFKQKGYQKNEYMTEQIVRKVFNQHSDTLLQMPFPNDMAQEIIDQCRQSKLQLTPKSLGEVINDAYQILVTRVRQLDGQNGLINTRTTLLEGRKQKLAKLENTEQNSQSIEQLKNQINLLGDDLKLLYHNQRVFTSQIYTIQQLFKKYIPISKKRKSYRQAEQQIPYVLPSSKNLIVLFYLGVVGLILQFFVVQLRPGWIAIVIHFQIFYLLFIGYYNRKAVMSLTLTNAVSILLDVGGIVIIQIFDVDGLNFQPSFFWYNFKIYALKIMLVVSIAIRVGILVAAYPYLEPPHQKISFKLCKSQFPINTRLKIGGQPHNYPQNWNQ